MDEERFERLKLLLGVRQQPQTSLSGLASFAAGSAFARSDATRVDNSGVPSEIPDNMLKGFSLPTEFETSGRMSKSEKKLLRDFVGSITPELLQFLPSVTRAAGSIGAKGRFNANEKTITLANKAGGADFGLIEFGEMPITPSDSANVLAHELGHFIQTKHSLNLKGINKKAVSEAEADLLGTSLILRQRGIPKSDILQLMGPSIIAHITNPKTFFKDKDPKKAKKHADAMVNFIDVGLGKADSVLNLVGFGTLPTTEHRFIREDN